MIWLALSILATSVVFLTFKSFEKYRIDVLPAIVVNYAVAAACGLALRPPTNLHAIIKAPWLPYALILGLGFILIFNLIGKTATIYGVAVTSAANKLSLIIPVTVAFFIYGDSLSLLKILGMAMVLIGIFLITKKENGEINPKYSYLPILLLVGSGINDALLKYADNYYVSDSELPLFISTIFVIASALGLFWTFTQKGIYFSQRNIIAGMLLGLPNFASIYFLLKTLDLPEFESSVIFPINNIGTLMAATLLAMLLFKEHLSKINWIGFIVSIIALILISL